MRNNRFLSRSLLWFREQALIDIDRVTFRIFLGTLFISAVFLGLTVRQPILEAHAFRQTQTAITSFWFMHDGLRLAYETPTLGLPWAIPFEFPFYQALVATLSALSPNSLTAIGRTVSYAFFVATLIPVWLICRELGLGLRTFLIFGSLYLVSPQYLFWGRTFMIESTALFFTVSFIAAALPLLTALRITPTRTLVIITLGSLAVLQKITTGLPPILLFGVLLASLAIRNLARREYRSCFSALARGALLLLPIFVGMIWTHFADAIKSEHEIARTLTSSALSSWNYGTVVQRFSAKLWLKVVALRAIEYNAASLLGVVIMVRFFKEETRMRSLQIFVTCLGLFLLPLLMFTNVHLVHDYYQSASTIYLIFALAMALAYLAEHQTTRVYITALALCVGLNLIHFGAVYVPNVTRTYNETKSQTLALAKFLREHTKPSEPILVYGYDWSSELPFYSQRRALVVPDFFLSYDEPLHSPEHFLGTPDPGALVVCQADKTAAEDALQSFRQAHPSMVETWIPNCRVFTRRDE
jgi:hypothetical protein